MDIPVIPRLPTDNLYKFVAMSGVLMLLFGFGVVAYAFVRVDSDWQPIVMESNARAVRIDAANSYWRRANTIALRGGTAKSVNSVRDSARALFDSITQSRRLYDARRADVTSREDTLELFVKSAFILALIGLFLTAWGFVNWYVKLQKPLDEIVRRRSLAMAEAESRSPADEG